MSTGPIPEFGEGGFPQPEGGFPADDLSEGAYSLTPSLEEGRCCNERAQNVVAAAVAQLANSVQIVVANMEQKVEEPCKKLDECIDKIIDALRKKVEGPLYSCDQCRAMVAQGLAGTLEYAVRCANVVCDQCVEVCSGQDDGKCCKSCGEDKVNCKCKAGRCEGEDKPDDGKKRKYIAWCNPVTGQIAVTRNDQEGMTAPWYQVGLTETEAAAVELATKNCSKIEVTVRSSPEQGPPVLSHPSGSCDFDAYRSGNGPLGTSGNLSLIQTIGSAAQVYLAGSEIGIGNINLENTGEVLWGLARYFTGEAPFLASKLLPEIIQSFGCPNPVFKSAISALTELQFADKALGISLSDYYQAIKYQANLACRTKFITPDQAMAAYLANAISRQDTDTLFGMAGVCPENLDWMEQATKAKPVPLQLAMMRHRGIISSGDYHSGMRQLGYLEPEVSENLFTLTYQLPTLTDIIRFMVRDADDENLVAKFGLDSNFTDKYQQQLRKWSEQQGVPEVVAKYAWRSHWQIPSPTQLFEFWRRLRHNDKFGGEAKLQEDIKAALIQQDILPYWHDHYLAVSYLPLGRIDLRRAYAIGSIDDKQLRDGLQKLGHSDDDAQILVKFFDRLRRNQIQSSQPAKLWKQFTITRQEAEARLTADGLPADQVKQSLDDIEQQFDKSIYAQAFAKGDIDRQELVTRLVNNGISNAGAGKIADRVSLRVRRHPALTAYAAGGLSKNDALAEMTSFGLDTSVANTLLTKVETDVKWSLLSRCQNGIKQRYLGGELTKGESSRLLANAGTVPERIRILLDEWDCEKSAVGKAIPTATLCSLLEQGVITATDFEERLRNIGYTDDDATILVNNCIASLELKRQKQLEAEIKARQHSEQQRLRALARAANAAKREGEATARAAKAAADTRKRREKQVIDAAEKLYKKCDCDLFTAIGAARVAREHVISTYHLDIDTTLAILIKAAENMTGGSLDDYNSQVDALATEVVNTDVSENSNSVGDIEAAGG